MDSPIRLFGIIVKDIQLQRSTNRRNFSPFTRRILVILQEVQSRSIGNLMIVFVSWRDSLLVNWNSSMGDCRCESLSNNWYRTVNLNVVETGRFYQGLSGLCTVDAASRLCSNTVAEVRIFHDYGFIVVRSWGRRNDWRNDCWSGFELWIQRLDYSWSFRSLRESVLSFDLGHGYMRDGRHVLDERHSSYCWHLGGSIADMLSLDSGRNPVKMRFGLDVVDVGYSCRIQVWHPDGHETTVPTLQQCGCHYHEYHFKLHPVVIR